MMQECRRPFDETLLSGYVDLELTQADEQRVRLHLEDCPGCRSMVDELQEMRRAALTTPLALPADEEWQERPRSAGSRWLRLGGWLLVVVAAFGGGWLALHGLLEGDATWYEKALVGVSIAGVSFLFLSVLIDRLRSIRSDRYLGVEK